MIYLVYLYFLKKVEDKYMKLIKTVRKCDRIKSNQYDMFTDVILMLDINNLFTFNKRDKSARCEMV